MCHCPEGKIPKVPILIGSHKVIPGNMPAVHDCKYIVARNDLIPKAEQMAKQREKNGGEFGLHFHHAMNELWARRA